MKGKKPMTLLTEAQVAAMIPTNKEAADWCAALNDMLPKYEITTSKRIAGFVSQCAHESADFKLLEENLNYREETLNKIFKRYFGPGKRNASEYAKQPEKIANYVYMDEFRTNKLGNTQPGDGWLFRGKGLKQVTGRFNHTEFGKTIGMTAEEAAEYLMTKKGALESALWFWDSRNLNAVADTADVVRLTKIINGGDIGLADRQRRFAEAMAILSGEIIVATSGNAAVAETLRRGSSGNAVKKLQAVLGLTADGSFGPGTEAALKKWQMSNGLIADGVAGPKTLAILLK